MLVLLFSVGSCSPVVEITLPDFRGAQFEDVSSFIEDSGIEFRVIEEISDESSGTVLRTVPLGNSLVRMGDKIDIFVSTGPEKFVITDFYGLRLEPFRTMITNKGVLVEVREEKSNDLPKGLITRTSPKAGSLIAPGEILEIWISSGADQVDAFRAVLEWDNKKDDWPLFMPFVENGWLIFDAEPVFSREVTLDGFCGVVPDWHPGSKDSLGCGRASVKPSFEQRASVHIGFQDRRFLPGESQEVRVGIKTAELGESFPEIVYIDIFTEDIYEPIELTLRIVW